MKKIILIFLLIIGSFSYSFGKEERNVIRVVGESVVTATPDTVRLNIDISEIKPTYDEVYLASSKTLDLIQDKLRSKGVKKEQIKTTNFNIDSYYENVRKEDGSYERKFMGYRYSHNFYIDFSINDKKIGEVLDVFNGLKIDNIGVFLAYKLKDDSEIKNKAMVEAYNDAYQKAKLIAKTGDFSLGKIIEIDYNSKGNNEGVIHFADKSLNIMKASSNFNFQPEDLKFRDTVTVIWKIK